MMCSTCVVECSSCSNSTCTWCARAVHVQHSVVECSVLLHVARITPSSPSPLGPGPALLLVQVPWGGEEGAPRRGRRGRRLYPQRAQPHDPPSPLLLFIHRIHSCCLFIASATAPGAVQPGRGPVQGSCTGVRTGALYRGPYRGPVQGPVQNFQRRLGACSGPGLAGNTPTPPHPLLPSPPQKPVLGDSVSSGAWGRAAERGHRSS
jgi:hypothetical protein